MVDITFHILADSPANLFVLRLQTLFDVFVFSLVHLLFLLHGLLLIAAEKVFELYSFVLGIELVVVESVIAIGTRLILA